MVKRGLMLFKKDNIGCLPACFPPSQHGPLASGRSEPHAGFAPFLLISHEQWKRLPLHTTPHRSSPHCCHNIHFRCICHHYLNSPRAPAILPPLGGSVLYRARTACGSQPQFQGSSWPSNAPRAAGGSISTALRDLPWIWDQFSPVISDHYSPILLAPRGAHELHLKSKSPEWSLLVHSDRLIKSICICDVCIWEQHSLSFIPYTDYAWVSSPHISVSAPFCIKQKLKGRRRVSLYLFPYSVSYPTIKIQIQHQIKG